jgi:hypothetical protein
VGEGIQGDCVVPVRSALLRGANNIILQGVFHSMSRIGTFDERGQPAWYGSDEVVDHWLCHLAEGAEQGEGTRGGDGCCAGGLTVWSSG